VFALDGATRSLGQLVACGRVARARDDPAAPSARNHVHIADRNGALDRPDPTATQFAAVDRRLSRLDDGTGLPHAAADLEDQSLARAEGRTPLHAYGLHDAEHARDVRSALPRN